MEHNGRDFEVHWSAWLDSGGEHSHVIPQLFHLKGDNICGGVIIVNLHMDSRQRLLQSCLAGRAVAKASDKGQNKYGNTENLCGCHIQDIFYEVPSVLRGLFGQLQIS